MNGIISKFAVNLKYLIGKKYLILFVLFIFAYIMTIISLAGGDSNEVLGFIMGPSNENFTFSSVVLWLLPYTVFLAISNTIIYNIDNSLILSIIVRLKHKKDWIFFNLILTIVINLIFNLLLYALLFFYLNNIITIKVGILSFFTCLLFSMLSILFYQIGISNKINFSVLLSILIFNTYSFALLRDYSIFWLGNQSILIRMSPYVKSGFSLKESILVCVFYSLLLVIIILKTNFKVERG